MKISICLCTFRREALLESLLVALADQAAGRPYEILVADNDPNHSAREVLERQAARLPIALRWAHVPEPNIARARNAAIAMGGGDAFVFIDDDEHPQPGWLDALINTQAQYGADAVFAPVVATYRPETPQWIKDGKFFERARFATGTALSTSEARTGNVLILREILLSVPGPFDASFGNTGGEDTHLFRTLADQGATFLWCDEAVVTEEVPADRATFKWLMRRSYRVGQTYLRSEWRAAATFSARCRVIGLLGRAVVQLFIASAAALVCLPMSKVRTVHWLRKAVSQVGKLSVLVGHRFHEYGKPTV